MAIAGPGIALHRSIPLPAPERPAEITSKLLTRAAHRPLIDPVVGQNAGLTFGRRSAMAAHGRENERACAARLPEIDYGAHDRIDLGDSAAARANRDPRIGGNPSAMPDESSSPSTAAGISLSRRSGRIWRMAMSTIYARF